MIRFFIELDADAIENHLSGNLDIGIVLSLDPKVAETAKTTPKLQPFLNRLLLVPNPERGKLVAMLMPYMKATAAGHKIVYTKAAKEKGAEAAALHAGLQEYIRFVQMATRAPVMLAPYTQINGLLNLASVIYHPPPAVFKMRFKKKPVVVVSAGPSLEKNIDELAKAQGEAVIIAVGTIYKSLLDAGIHPHFVCTLDWSAACADYLDRSDSPETILFGIPSAHWKSIDIWPHRRLLAGHMGLLGYLQRLGLNRDIMAAGGSVAHLAFNLAIYLGGSPVILVGQDLCFKGGQTHYGKAGKAGPEYVKSLRAVLPDSAKRVSPNMYHWQGQCITGPLRERLDVDGNLVYTDGQMEGYLNRLEELIVYAKRQFKTRVIDATEGGLPKAGTERLTLKQARERYCRWQVKVKPFTGPLRRYYKDVPAQDKVVALLRESQERLGKLRNIYEETAVRLRKVDRQAEVGEELDWEPIWEETTKMYMKAGEQAPEEHYQVRLLNTPEEQRKEFVGQTVAGKPKQEARRAAMGCNLDTCVQYAKSADWLREWLDQAITRVETFDVEKAKEMWA